MFHPWRLGNPGGVDGGTRVCSHMITATAVGDASYPLLSYSDNPSSLCLQSAEPVTPDGYYDPTNLSQATLFHSAGGQLGWIPI
jgi:hypothetical protein